MDEQQFKELPCDSQRKIDIEDARLEMTYMDGREKGIERGNRRFNRIMAQRRLYMKIYKAVRS